LDSHFCTSAKGNEKGSVENLVGYARRNFLVPVPEVRSLDELNEFLRAACIQNRQRRHPLRPAVVGRSSSRSVRLSGRCRSGPSTAPGWFIPE